MLNSRWLVEDVRVAFRLRKNAHAFVTRVEVNEAVTLLMCTEEGQVAKKNVARLQIACGDPSLSDENLRKCVEDLRNQHTGPTDPARFRKCSECSHTSSLFLSPSERIEMGCIISVRSNRCELRSRREDESSHIPSFMHMSSDGSTQPLRRSLNVPYLMLEAYSRATSVILRKFRGHGAVALTRGPFRARHDCCTRSYDYLLLAAIIGIHPDTDSSEAEQRVEKFRSLLRLFEGKHAFHNYKIRRLYRPFVQKAYKSRPHTRPADDYSDEQHDKSPTSKNSREFEFLDEDDLTDKLSDILAGEHGGFLLPIDQTKWSSHFRKVLSCSCELPEAYGETQLIRISMTSSSFMVNQCSPVRTGCEPGRFGRTSAGYTGSKGVVS